MHPSDGRVVSNFIMQTLQNHPITLEGSQIRRFCYVDDLIDVFLRFMEAPDEVTGPINPGDPAELTVRQLAGLVVEMTNSKSEIAHKKLPADTIRGSEGPISRSRRSI